MDIQPIQDAVDIAAATAARKEFIRIRNETLETGSRVDVVQSVAKSLRSLQRLSARETPTKMPNYDEWDAVFYPAWYQPKQINIVCSALQAVKENGVYLGGEKRWDGDIFGIADGRAHFVDFGCGSLAMQFAVAIAAADSISQGRELREIRIDSYDPKPEMIRVGQNIWDEFVRRMKIHHPRHPICKVFDLIQCETHAELDTLPEATDAPRFLSAIHAVYEESPVKDDLESLVAKYAPAGFLFTTHVSSRRLLHSMSPIAGDGRYAKKSITIPNHRARFKGESDALTRWRRARRHSFLDKGTLPPDAGIVSDYLNGTVKWQYPYPAIHLYMRKDISEFTG